MDQQDSGWVDEQAGECVGECMNDQVSQWVSI